MYFSLLFPVIPMVTLCQNAIYDFNQSYFRLDIRVYRYVDNISQELIGKLMIIDWLGGEQSRPEKCSWAKEM